MNVWEDIRKYGGNYQISIFGTVKSVARIKIRSNGHKQFIRERILKHGYSKDGYPIVGLQFNGKLSTEKIHRLVAFHFIPNPENKPQVNHKNGIKTDNRMWNLEWTTISENVKHAFATGLHKGHIGERNPNRKSVINTVTGITYNTAKAAAKVAGLNYSFFCNQLKGHRLNRTSFKYS